jgi:dTDP-4-dehydrorhamnose 3,5-epimerase-like enzyme
VTSSEPELIPGGCSADDRGRVYFANNFDPSGCHRLYMVENFGAGVVRAWHAHRRESKWVMAVAGAALACCVRIDDWDSPAKEARLHRFALDAANPSVLAIPAGYANGAMSLTESTKLLYFSDSTLEDSLDDDIRYPARYWDPWHVPER